MIIQVSPESPDLVRAIASLVLGAHIVAGSVGLLSGGTAIIAPEGGALHRWSGTTFVLSMLLMSGIGVAAAPLMPQRSSVVPGLLTFFLVGTGWLAVKRPGPPVGLLSLMALVFALVAVTLGVTFRLMAADSSSGLLGGHGASNFYILAAMAVIAAVLDIKVMWGTSLAGAQRMRRHLRRNGGPLFSSPPSPYFWVSKGPTERFARISDPGPSVTNVSCGLGLLVLARRPWKTVAARPLVRRR